MKLDAQLGTTALSLLHTPQPPTPEAVLAVLVSELASRDSGDFALVLDDYHVLTAEPIQRGMAFLLEHLPPQLHLILATRADPALPLARLRAQGQLCEVRTADLCFEAVEVRAFLEDVMGLDFPPEVIVALGHSTEGWIAGLQLAARPAGQAPAGRCHVCTGGAGGPPPGGVAHPVQLLLLLFWPGGPAA